MNEEYIKLLETIKEAFDDLWGKCWEAADEVEEHLPEIYDILSSLAIDAEERMNKMTEIINILKDKANENN